MQLKYISHSCDQGNFQTALEKIRENNILLLKQQQQQKIYLGNCLKTSKDKKPSIFSKYILST